MFMCNKNYQKRFDENLKKRFFNTYTFYNHDVNTFISLLRKGVSTHMNIWTIGKNSVKLHYLKKNIFTVI